MQDMEEQGIVEFNHRFDDDLLAPRNAWNLPSLK